MALLSRVSAAVGRSSSCSARTQLSRFNAVADLSHASKSAKSSFVRPISTQPAVEAASSAGRSSGLGNVLLGTTLVAAGVGTVYFTHLRMRHSGWGVSANTIMDDGLHPAEHPWPNNHPFATYDHARYAIVPLLLVCVQTQLTSWVVCGGDSRCTGKCAVHATPSTELPGETSSA